MEFIAEHTSYYNNNMVALYFHARWMDNSMNKKYITMISKVESSFNDIKFYAINTDDFKNLCKIYNITAIPTVVILKKGKEISRINGMPLTAAFKKVFADICMSDTLNIGA